MPRVIARQFPDTPYGVPDGVREYRFVYMAYDLSCDEKTPNVESMCTPKARPGDPIGGVGELSGNYPVHPQKNLTRTQQFWG